MQGGRQVFDGARFPARVVCASPTRANDGEAAFGENDSSLQSPDLTLYNSGRKTDPESP
jgi:hypothetical protein